MQKAGAAIDRLLMKPAAVQSFVEFHDPRDDVTKRHTLCTTLNTVLAPPQLMSELVRKAEADINGLRVKLAAAGTAPRPDLSATSHSAALLQVRCSMGSGELPCSVFGRDCYM